MRWHYMLMVWYYKIWHYIIECNIRKLGAFMF